MTTIKDLINEKLKNLEKFVLLKFSNNELIKDQIKQMNNLPIESFILYIKNYVKIHKDNMDNFFNKLLDDYKINKNDINNDDLEKFKKYFNFFNEIVDELEN